MLHHVMHSDCCHDTWPTIRFGPKQFLAARKSCYCRLRNKRVLEISDPKHPTFQLFDKDERISYLETKVAQQQQNLQLFKTMLQQKEVYVMDLEDEVNNTFIFLENARALMIRIIIQHNFIEYSDNSEATFQNSQEI